MGSDLWNMGSDLGNMGSDLGIWEVNLGNLFWAVCPYVAWSKLAKVRNLQHIAPLHPDKQKKKEKYPENGPNSRLQVEKLIEENEESRNGFLHGKLVTSARLSEKTPGNFTLM